MIYLMSLKMSHIFVKHSFRFDNLKFSKCSLENFVFSLLEHKICKNHNFIYLGLKSGPRALCKPF